MIEFINRLFPEIPNQNVRVSSVGTVIVDSFQLVKSKEFARQAEALRKIRDRMK